MEGEGERVERGKDGRERRLVRKGSWGRRRKGEEGEKLEGRGRGREKLLSEVVDITWPVHHCPGEAV